MSTSGSGIAAISEIMPDQDRFREMEHLSTQHSRGSNAVDVRYDSENYLYNFFDYEQGSSEPIVRGRMKANIDFWRHIGAHDDILQVIEHGYKLPLLTTPPPAHFKNNYSALNNYDFVSGAIISLIQNCWWLRLSTHYPFRFKARGRNV